MVYWNIALKGYWLVFIFSRDMSWSCDSSASLYLYFLSLTPTCSPDLACCLLTWYPQLFSCCWPLPATCSLLLSADLVPFAICPILTLICFLSLFSVCLFGTSCCLANHGPSLKFNSSSYDPSFKIQLHLILLVSWLQSAYGLHAVGSTTKRIYIYIFSPPH